MKLSLSIAAAQAREDSKPQAARLNAISKSDYPDYTLLCVRCIAKAKPKPETATWKTGDSKVCTGCLLECEQGNAKPLLAVKEPGGVEWE